MNFYRNDYSIATVLENMPSREQKMLTAFTGTYFSKPEAKEVWERIVDHKWYVGEKLQRDIGLRVAAIDFVENFYEPILKNNTDNKKPNTFGRMLRIFFVSKSGQMSA